MEYDFDPAKDEANRFKHGLRLAYGMRVFDDADHLILPTFRPEDGEDRFKAIGRVDGKLHTLIYIERVGSLRLISVRRSNGSEQREYDRDSSRS